jgi:group I intron endonuclease
MVINKALKKHGHSKFTLEILEYCEPCDVISREQYYLDLFADLAAKYNILPIARSSLGFKDAPLKSQELK